MIAFDRASQGAKITPIAYLCSDLLCVVDLWVSLPGVKLYLFVKVLRGYMQPLRIL